ncbi:hypothetical protein, partial [Acinetobacter baumannii]|uniref:hypothetical protein n=1 Tax=Acinetobacter baumannii TaxID=470 RepID=UPI001D0E6CBB
DMPNAKAQVKRKFIDSPCLLIGVINLFSYIRKQNHNPNSPVLSSGCDLLSAKAGYFSNVFHAW